MENNNISETQETQESKSSNLATIIVVVVLLTTLAVGGFLFFKNKKGAESTASQQPINQPQVQLSPQEQLKAALAAAQQAPTVPNLIALGLAYFNNGMYPEAIAINSQVLQVDSTNSIACNNICASYNNLGRYQEAAYFCSIALRFDTANTLAKNNLDYSQKQIVRIGTLQEKVKTSATKEEYVELGLFYYKRKEFKQAIEVYEKGVKEHTDAALLLNNLGASYCEIKQWDKGIEYCQRALKLDPDFTLAKNNLKWAEDGKAGKYN